LNNTEYHEFKNFGIPEINGVWISAEYRGHGFGKRLVQRLEAIALKENHKQVGIGVGLYKDYGFAQKLYVRMECLLDKVVEVRKGIVDLILAEVVRVHIHNDILNSDGYIDVSKLNPLARLAGISYAKIDPFCEIPRGL
jgi:GNAT superfamily N-acetyltransferase